MWTRNKKKNCAWSELKLVPLLSQHKHGGSTTSWLQGLHNPSLLRLYANAITKDNLKINVSSPKNQSAINLKARASWLSMWLFFFFFHIFFLPGLRTMSTGISDSLERRGQTPHRSKTKPSRSLESCCSIKHVNCRGTGRWSAAVSACFLTAGTKAWRPGRRLLSDAPLKAPVNRQRHNS